MDVYWSNGGRKRPNKLLSKFLYSLYPNPALDLNTHIQTQNFFLWACGQLSLEVILLLAVKSIKHWSRIKDGYSDGIKDNQIRQCVL